MNCPLPIAHEMSALTRTRIIQLLSLPKEVEYGLSPVRMGADNSFATKKNLEIPLIGLLRFVIMRPLTCPIVLINC